ncbi:MAG: sensor histidine kinase [Thalassotalea sp.]
MSFLKQPFYLRSFIILLGIDVSYTVTMLLLNPQHYRFAHSEFISFIWFVFFYLVPIWSAAALIFKLRSLGRSHPLIELPIVMLAMIIGNFIVDLILNHYFKYQASFGYFVIANGMMWAVVLYFLNLFFENRQRIKVEQKAKKQAQLQTLRYQLNPHFMFNSLNTISAYIHTKPDIADQVLHNLADVLRYSLDTAEKAQVTLAQELKMIDTYLAIEETRFGERLTVIKNIDQAMLTSPIPPLLLQPIIENTIKHCGQQKLLMIEIQVTQKNEKLHIVVQDNGPGFPAEVVKNKHGKGIGMKNLLERIAQLPNSSLQLSNTPGARIEMELML